ncbi:MULTISPECIES: TetR/AcrR family transcriptional regulator [unclassified Mycolicibacterium]|uniref:TetR/AcrR family transcriptional regulator n=1 Tax=unclassified Mycolicibacterium TaxID=2636767 RepID=UPI0012DC16D2|nr:MULTISPECIES: TetR/AcrR family transcriptional regulator [unclassified Mycolicibacterium]MUL81431.1 TetR/AcrR family transcriptional regulator [Mycolicibacterium sp. CBMA 329]MUL87197.1 TetR/AcrR family transcriptional regulator [Mycolicibacterium sp. CBMA 331]MUL98521.1 TetR/AcrR family transcriptional regulator [Mycolicibacterium sp. CBMA 334]MUM29595.1 TetR/AcrR family transcriptional regulator [Mycolicibacterium sp. CBMA 295]MUM37494.1 TetR/AcrR family transcriptional regulator [Mycolic
MGRTLKSESPRRRRRQTNQGVLLSEPLIVETALRVLKYHGAAGLTVRRLGTALGADPSALYRYFRGIEDVVLAITDELLRRVAEGWEPTGRWREDMRELGLRVHRVYLEHPQAGVLSASRVTGSAHEIRVIEQVLGLLRSAGFPEREAVEVYHAFIDQMLGLAALDAAFEALPAEHQKRDDDKWRDTYAQLPAETHPNIAATSRLLGESMRRSACESALELTLDGIAARLDSYRPGP